MGHFSEGARDGAGWKRDMMAQEERGEERG